MAFTPGIHSRAAQETATKNSAARLSIVVAVFLIALKTTSGWMTGSISVWASLLDSVLDLFASTLNFIAVRASSRPADEDHAYGHGKAESLTSLFQALVIGASGMFIIWEAVHRIREPHQIHSEVIGVGSMIIDVLRPVTAGPPDPQPFRPLWKRAP